MYRLKIHIFKIENSKNIFKNKMFSNLVVKIIYSDIGSYSTGIMISDGFILTCAHCYLGDNFTLSLSPEFNIVENKPEYECVYYKNENSDLCIMYFERIEKSISHLNLNYPKFLKKECQIGDKTFSWGFPFSDKAAKNPDLIKGIISSPLDKCGCFKIQAPINNGNSGGPVFIKNKENGNFELSGIVVSKSAIQECKEKLQFDSEIMEFEKSLMPFVENLKINKITSILQKLHERVRKIDYYATYGFGSFISINIIVEFLTECSNRIVMNEKIREKAKKVLTENFNT